MNFTTIARHLVQKSAMDVARGRREDSVTEVRQAMLDAQSEAEPRLKKLEVEVAQLRKALAYHYSPSLGELAYWTTHKQDVLACSGSPPNYENWKVNVALTHVLA